MSPKTFEDLAGTVEKKVKLTCCVMTRGCHTRTHHSDSLWHLSRTKEGNEISYPLSDLSSGPNFNTFLEFLGVLFAL